MTVDAPVLGPQVDVDVYEWSQATSTSDTIINETNVTANTRSGERYGDGGSTWLYPEDERGEETDNYTDYDYEIDYIWDPVTETWSTGCISTNTISDAGGYGNSDSYDYTDSGVGWSCSGTVSDSSSGSWSYFYITTHELSSTGWQMIGGYGNAMGQGTSQWSYNETGNYWPASPGETISGTFQDGGQRPNHDDLWSVRRIRPSNGMLG